VTRDTADNAEIQPAPHRRQDVATASSEYLELPIEFCGAYCDWTFLFAEDGRLMGTQVPMGLENFNSTIGDAWDKCLAEATGIEQ
jgi:hypothetical protein